METLFATILSQMNQFFSNKYYMSMEITLKSLLRKVKKNVFVLQFGPSHQEYQDKLVE